MSTASNPNPTDYFATNPSVDPDLGADLDAVINYIIGVLNSLDDENVDGDPKIQAVKIDLTGSGFLPLTGGDLSGLLGHAFQGIWRKMNIVANGQIREYRGSDGAIWGLAYNTEWNGSSWDGRDKTDICWAIKYESDGFHIYHAVSAASGAQPSWTEIFHVNTSGVFQVTDSVKTSNVQAGAITPAKLQNFAAGDILITSDDTQYSLVWPNATPIKMTSLRVKRNGTLRIKFLGNITFGGAANAQIYRDGSAVGTLQTLVNGGSTFSEDISGWTAGDMVELWLAITAADGGDSALVQNFRIYSDYYFWGIDS